MESDSITIDKESLPDGYVITAQNMGGDDSRDSDVNPEDGKSDTITINDNRDVTLDAGIYSQTYCLGNFIWYDNNHNGIQDLDETGVEDISITLNETGDVTKTDDRGYYEFCELKSGNYSITVDKSTIPDGYEITSQNRGDNGALDSDIDPDSGKSDAVTIDGGSNTTLDGGIYRATHCIGDLIWFDDNRDGIQNSGENGVNGVKISLNETGDVTRTDNRGRYQCAVILRVESTQLQLIRELYL